MACSALHLLIAQEYCKKHKILDVNTYFWGAILPDIHEDKTSSHFGRHIKPTSIEEMLDAKVDIHECIYTLNFQDEDARAIFLHILTDYIYYNYLYKAPLQNMSASQILSAINNDAGVMTTEILKEHSFPIPNNFAPLLIPKENTGRYQLFRGDKLNSFIETISSLDLDETILSILRDKQAFIEQVINQINESEDFDCKRI